MSKKILITDKVHPLLPDGLSQDGMSVTYRPDMNYSEVQATVRYFDALIINSKVICDRPFLEFARHLDFIGRLGSGLDIVDLDAAKEMGIEVISSPEGNANAVAEHAIGLLLNLLNHICRAHAQIRSLQWNREQNRGIELAGKTFGILGFGNTGSALAKKLKEWEVNIITYDKYRKGIDREYAYVRQVGFSELVSQSDILSIHLPLTSETRGWIDTSVFKSMKEGAILINTSRGKIVVQSDLIQSLEKRHLSGACLDVLENEQPETMEDHEISAFKTLTEMENVIITPHIAGWTHESLYKIAKELLRKILKYYGR